MQLASPFLDIGLVANTLQPLLDFWQGEVGLDPERVNPVRPGVNQHRYHLLGSVLKINHHAAPLPPDPPSGFLELLVAREGLSEVRAMADPDGNRLRLVPPGYEGVRQIAMRMGVRDLATHRRFYGEVLGLPEERPGAFRAGESLLLLEADASAPADPLMDAVGWRYITFQVVDCVAEYAAVTARGGQGAREPFLFKGSVYVGIVRDPDGAWIEIIQRVAPAEAQS